MSKCKKLVIAGIFVSVLLVAGVWAGFQANLDFLSLAEALNAGSKENSKTVTLPQGGSQDSKYFDLNRDGEKERLVLSEGNLQVFADKRVIWSTPEEWWVDFYFPGDATNDGFPELNLVVWRRGSYGSVKPFWVEEDDSFKCHLFLFRLEEDHEMRPVWQSSSLPYPVYEVELKDVSGDEENKLLVIGGCYREPHLRQSFTYKWDEFGFTRVD